MAPNAADEHRGRAWVRLVIGLNAPLAAWFAAGLVPPLVSKRVVISTDFSVFWTAWRLILHGQGGSLYDRAAQWSAQHQVMDGLEFHGGLMAFLNPPHVALAGVPLGWLADHAGERAALVVWTAVNLVLVARLVRLTQHTLGFEGPRLRWAVALVVLGFYPVFYGVSIGQLSVLLAVAAFELFRAIERDRPWTAAAWLVVFTVKPQLLPPLLVFLAARRHWAVLARAAALGAVIVALTALVLGPSIWLEYLRNVHGLERFFGSGTPVYMMNLRGALTRLFQSAPPDRLFDVAVGAWLAASAALGLALTRRGDARSDYALTLAVALLFCPHLFAQDAVIWVPAIALQIAALRARGVPVAPLAGFVAFWPALFAVMRMVDLGAAAGPTLRIDPVVTAMFIATGLIVHGRWRLAVR